MYMFKIVNVLHSLIFIYSVKIILYVHIYMNKLKNKEEDMLHRNVHMCDLLVQTFLNNLNNNNNNKFFRYFLSNNHFSSKKKKDT